MWYSCSQSYQYLDYDMKEYIEIEGVIRYDPPRVGMKKNTDFWCILELPHELVKYYQYFVKTDLHIPLADPSWGAHVSIVRGETPPKPELWKKYDGKRVKIRYYPYIHVKKDPKKAGLYCFIDFEVPFFRKIRAELGLQSKYTFHFTIGRTHYD